MNPSPFDSINTQTMRQDRIEEARSAFWAIGMCLFVGLCAAFTVIATWEQIDFQYEETRDE